MKVVRALLLALLTSAVVAAGVIAVARLFGWQVGPLYFLVALTPYVGVGCLLIALLAAVLRAWWLVVPSAALAVLVSVWWVPVFRPAADDSAGWDLQVMTTNLQFGRGDPTAVVALVRDHDVDLLSVQELTPEARRALRAAGLDQLLPHSFVRATPDAAGTGLWSRYSLRDRRETSGLIFENLRATVVTPAGRVTFCAVHPPAPPPLDGSRHEAIAAAVNRFITAAPGPALAAGDFNATLDHRPIRELEEAAFADAADAAGAGLVPTWPDDLRPLPPLVAIDHVMARDTPPARTIAVVAVPGTDHLALIAEY